MSRVQATVNLMMMSNVDDPRDGEYVCISWDGRGGGEVGTGEASEVLVNEVEADQFGEGLQQWISSCD